MRRTATHDAELGGQHIRAGRHGGHVVRLGQPRSDAIEDPDNFIIDRARPRQHLSFGLGIHRCVGNRLAELQLRILWQELLPRHPIIEVLAAPCRTYSNFIHGRHALDASPHPPALAPRPRQLRPDHDLRSLKLSDSPGALALRSGISAAEASCTRLKIRKMVDSIFGECGLGRSLVGLIPTLSRPFSINSSSEGEPCRFFGA
jgi:hypothetical protein